MKEATKHLNGFFITAKEKKMSLEERATAPPSESSSLFHLFDSE